MAARRINSEKSAIPVKTFSVARIGPQREMVNSVVFVLTKNSIQANKNERDKNRSHAFRVLFFDFSIRILGSINIKYLGFSTTIFPRIIPSIIPGIDILRISIQVN